MVSLNDFKLEAEFIDSNIAEFSKQVSFNNLPNCSEFEIECEYDSGFSSRTSSTSQLDDSFDFGTKNTDLESNCLHKSFYPTGIFVFYTSMFQRPAFLKKTVSEWSKYSIERLRRSLLNLNLISDMKQKLVLKEDEEDDDNNTSNINLTDNQKSNEIDQNKVFNKETKSEKYFYNRIGSWGQIFLRIYDVNFF